MIRITVLNNPPHPFPEGITPAEVFKELCEAKEQPLGAMLGGRVLALNEALTEDCTLSPLYYRDDEGRRIYERTLRFVLLYAMDRLYPDKQLRFMHTISHSHFVTLADDSPMPHGMAAALEEEMRRIVKADYPIQRDVWKKGEALSYYLSRNATDRAALLPSRSGKELPVYRCGEFRADLFGILLPSTALVPVFSITAHYPGLMLQLPAPADPDHPVLYKPHSRFMRTLTATQAWCGILGAKNASDINDMIRKNRYREFIRVNEALHDKQLSDIADEIVRRRARIVIIFGPSSSGKTTTANRICVHLRVLCKTPHLISLDNFYKGRDQTPIGEDGQPDYECVEALDTDLLHATLEGLMIGQTMPIPEYDFTTGSRKPDSSLLHLGENDILVLEGIHGMNDVIQSRLPEQITCNIFASALACINLDHQDRIRTTDVRLIRRIVRDMRFRGTSPRETIAMWPKVRAGEDQWIFPHQEKADLIFNSSLHYELPFLKQISWEALSAITPDMQEYHVARRLLDLMDPFLLPDEEIISEVPPLSILREFIGNCTFYDHH